MRDISRPGKWDITHKMAIEMVEKDTFCFDPELSYETTGYIPITETKGLDFDPAPFQEVGNKFDETGRFSDFPWGGKLHMDFWKKEFEKCNNGLTIGKYTITGDHYFFLNFYTMLNITKITKAGSGRTDSRPSFWAEHYKYFHYIELCQELGFDACLLKARGVGASETAASLAVRPYITVPNFKAFFTASYEKFLIGKGVLTSKVWKQLNWLDINSETAMRRVRAKIDSAMHKRASKVDKQNIESGHMSEISGQVVDNSDKLRGDRVDRWFLEESGSNGILIDTYLVGEALVIINGIRLGIRIVFGTGGSEGPQLEGLQKLHLNPRSFKILPFRHNFTLNKEYTETGYFMPAWSTVIPTMDKRGVVNKEKAMAMYQKERDRLYNSGNMEEYIKHCAEYCFTQEEALSREGKNSFNQTLLAEQRIEIEQLKSTPRPEKGNLFWIFEEGSNNIKGVRWEPDPFGDIEIVEHPILDEEGLPRRNLYVAGIDSIDLGVDDSTEGESKFCILIKKRLFGNQGNKYVSVYCKRPNDIREAYGVAARLLWYYGCKANLEDTKIGFRMWLREKKLDSRMLMIRPQLALSEQGARKKKGTLWGTPASPKMIAHGLELVGQYVEDYYYNIDFLEMIDQLQKYSFENKGRFDYVAAMQMAEIGDEEMYGLAVKMEQSIKNTWNDIGYYTDERGIKRFGVIQKNHAIAEDIKKSLTKQGYEFQ